MDQARFMAAERPEGMGIISKGRSIPQLHLMNYCPE